MEIVKVLWWGLAGVCYDFHNPPYENCSVTTYMNYEYFIKIFESGEYQKRHPNTIFANAWVIDKSVVLENDTSLSFKSPLLHTNLKNTEKKLENLTGWDYVDIETYINWWKLHGARIGKINSEGNSILWKI